MVCQMVISAVGKGEGIGVPLGKHVGAFWDMRIS